MGTTVLFVVPDDSSRKNRLVVVVCIVSTDCFLSSEIKPTFERCILSWLAPHEQGCSQVGDYLFPIMIPCYETVPPTSHPLPGTFRFVGVASLECQNRETTLANLNPFLSFRHIIGSTTTTSTVAECASHWSGVEVNLLRQM